jgi:hypothetical protein
MNPKTIETSTQPVRVEGIQSSLVKSWMHNRNKSEEGRNA